jgi:tetratricopeptide (TPR) repeat protein
VSGWPAAARITRPLLLVLAVGAVALRGQPLGLTGAPAAKANQGQTAQADPSGEEARLAAEAQDALRRGDNATAIPALEKLAKLAPRVAEVHANLASAYYSTGRFDRAAQHAGEALRLKPSLINAHYFLGLSLAEGDRCKEALPYLEQDYPRAPDLGLKRAMGTDLLQCAMSLNKVDKAVEMLRSLGRDFADDPDVLYLSAHLFSELSNQAAQHLLTSAPASYQAHQFNAEVLELQGKLGDARDEYRKVLSLKPNLAGIHCRLGELLLEGERGPNTLEEARRQFEEELKIDPRNVAAEYELGEMARQARQWDDATRHFERAAALEPAFAEALIGLGKALISADRTAEAVAPLKRAVTLEPDNPNAHYQLSFAYRRLGRNPEAENELAAYRDTHEKQRRTALNIRTGILGNITQHQTDSPPE